MKKDFLTYKEFIGTVHYSSEDEVFFGVIQGVHDLVTFEGNSVASLKKAFKEAVEEYLLLCEKNKKSPLKSKKGSFNVRLKPELHQKLFAHAIQQGLTLNQFIQKTLEKEIVNS